MNIRGRIKNGKPLHLAISALLVALVLLAGMPLAVSADDGTDVCRDDGPIDHLGSSDVVRGADNLPSNFTGICFIKGTLVKTENGEKPIEDMQAGDSVWSYDTESGKWQLETVSATFEHGYSGDIIAIDVAGSEIVATGNHPFWVVAGDDLADRAWPEDIYIYEKAMTETGRWVEARDLRVGDELLLIEGRAGITGLAIEDLDTTVYNIGVGELHTYAVSEAGVLVHNKAMRNANFVDPGDTVSVYRGTSHPSVTQTSHNIRTGKKSLSVEGDQTFLTNREAYEHAYHGRGYHPDGVSVTTDPSIAAAYGSHTIEYAIPRSVFDRLPIGDPALSERVFKNNVPDRYRVGVTSP